MFVLINGEMYVVKFKQHMHVIYTCMYKKLILSYQLRAAITIFIMSSPTMWWWRLIVFAEPKSYVALIYVS